MMKMLKHMSVKGITLVLIVCLTVFSGTIVTYQNLIEETKNDRDEVVDIVAEKGYEKLLIYFNSLLKQAQLESLAISRSISNNIYSQYSNLSILKNELDTSIYSEKLVNIFKANIENKYLNHVENENNGVIVADYSGIILDYRYSVTDNKIKRSWSEEANNHVNKELCNNAISKILEQKTDDIIAVQRYGEIIYDEITIDTFKEIYYNKGIEGFKNYTFLVPTYIYDHEDIFGDSDIVDGTKVDNHKLIVIQQFNLYDQINKLSDSVIKDNSVKMADSIYEAQLAKLYILGIILILSLVGLIFILCILYNLVMQELRKEQDEEDSIDRR